MHGPGQRHRRRTEVIRLVKDAGGHDVRVFGSVANGQDDSGSDVDLLFTMGRPLGLIQLGRLEAQISELLGAPVDVVPDDALRPAMRDRVLGQAIPL